MGWAQKKVQLVISSYWWPTDTERGRGLRTDPNWLNRVSLRWCLLCLDLHIYNAIVGTILTFLFLLWRLCTLVNSSLTLQPMHSSIGVEIKPWEWNKTLKSQHQTYALGPILWKCLGNCLKLSLRYLILLPLPPRGARIGGPVGWACRTLDYKAAIARLIRRGKSWKTSASPYLYIAGEKWVGKDVQTSAILSVNNDIYNICFSSPSLTSLWSCQKWHMPRSVINLVWHISHSCIMTYIMRYLFVYDILLFMK